MSKICVSINTSIYIFVSTCKQITQSEPSEFSKNGVFHSKAAVITFSNCLNLNPVPILHGLNFSCKWHIKFGILQLYANLRHYYRKYMEIEFIKNFCLRKFWSSNAIFTEHLWLFTSLFPKQIALWKNSLSNLYFNWCRNKLQFSQTIKNNDFLMKKRNRVMYKIIYQNRYIHEKIIQ